MYNIQCIYIHIQLFFRNLFESLSIRKKADYNNFDDPDDEETCYLNQSMRMER
jgi:hypothetical protein